MKETDFPSENFRSAKKIEQLRQVLKSNGSATTDETYTDAELARVSVLTFDVTQFVTSTVYVSPVANVWQVLYAFIYKKI